ncbi:MAG: bifunctional nuclease domain-containing protein, partial [bacterium]
MTPMRVIEVNRCPHTGRPMVMLQVEGRDRWLAFYIPMNEANRLARCLGMTQCPCTPIFELTEQLIGHMGAAVVRAYLEGDERGISAGLVLERDGAELLLPCHPADAVALAVRARAPIVAEDSALAHARSTGTPPPEE